MARVMAPRKPVLDEPVNPWDPYNPTAADTVAGGGGSTDQPWMPPAPDVISGPRPAPTPDGTTPRTPSAPQEPAVAPPPPTGVSPVPQQLPDGSGGAIPVPPAEMAPPPPVYIPDGIISEDFGLGGRIPPPTDPSPWSQPPTIEPPPVDDIDIHGGQPPWTPPGGPMPIGGGGPDPIRETPTVPDAPTPTAPAPEGTFTAGDNLIDAEILPTADPRAAEHDLAGDRGLAAQDAAPDIAPPSSNPRLLKFQQLTDDLLAQMRTQPDRLGLAKQYWDVFQDQTEGDYQRSLTDATNRGAAHGWMGSGMLTNSYGDLSERRARDMNAARGRLIADATAGTIGDRQRTYENFAAAERNAFGQAGADVDELQEEREARRRLIDAHYGQADRSLDRGRMDRAETRGERGYQSDKANEALIRRILQQQEERAAEQQNYNQAAGNFGAGNTGDPTDVYLSAADQQALQAAAAAGDVALMMRILAGRNQQQQPPRG